MKSGTYKTCIICNTDFYNFPSENKTCCSKSCATKNRFRQKNFKKGTFLNCSNCSKSFYVNKSRIKTAKFCSKSCAAIGENNPFYGKKHKVETLKKLSISHKNISNETRRKQRMSYIKYHESKNGQLFPNYNKIACKIIDEYGKNNGYNFQHAENGGEIHLKELGYWLDGYDKDKNVVIEFYEKHHNFKKEKDLIREKEIIDFLKCKFIIIHE